MGMGLQAARVDAGTCLHRVRWGEPRLVRVRRGERGGPGRAGPQAPRDFSTAAPAHMQARVLVAGGGVGVFPQRCVLLFSGEVNGRSSVLGPLLVEPPQPRCDRGRGVVVHHCLCCET